MEHLDDETREWMLANTKPCPSCGERFEKNAGCNVMRCPCGIEWDWVSGSINRPQLNTPSQVFALLDARQKAQWPFPPVESSSALTTEQKVFFDKAKRGLRAEWKREDKRREKGIVGRQRSERFTPQSVREQLTEDEREKYDFRPVLLVSQLEENERKAYESAKAMLLKRKEKKTWTEEKRAEVNATNSKKRKQKRATMTEEELERLRAYGREKTNAHNAKLRKTNPEHYKAIVARGNANRKPLTEGQKEKRRETSKAWYHSKVESDPEFLNKEAERRRLYVQSLSKKQLEEMNRKKREKMREVTEIFSRGGVLPSGASYGLRKCSTCEFAIAWTYEECLDCREFNGRRKEYELQVKELLESEELYPSSHDEVGPCKALDAPAFRCDFIFDAPDTNYCVFVEVDEDYHRSYNVECEVARMYQLRDQFPDKPVYFIRYHPKGEGGGLRNRTRTIEKEGNEELISAIKAALQLPPPAENEVVKGFKVQYIGYPEDRIKLLQEAEERMVREAFQQFQN